VFALTLLCSLSIPRTALAQRVLLLRPPESDATLSEAFNRLRAELMLQDFEVTVVDASPENTTPDALEDEAQRAGAFAGIALTRHTGGATADVCIADRVTGKTSQRRLAIGGRSEAPRVLAVRAVDLLRSSLRELPAGELPPADVIGAERKPEPPAIRAWSTPRRLWQLRAAGSALDGPARLGPAVGGSITLAYFPLRRLSTGIVLSGPLVGAHYTAVNGVATIRQELALARATYSVLPEGGRLTLGPLIGAGVYHLRAQSEVKAPLRSRSAGVLSFVGTAGLELELELAPALTLGATLSALLVTPKPVIAIDTSQRELKEPLIMASVGLGVGF
jgi:hypothetical protein